MFAILDTVEPILEAIKDNEFFVVNLDVERGFGTVIYTYKTNETFLPITDDLEPAERERRLLIQECRGLKFDIETGKILSRPYHKFKNLNEDSTVQVDKIDWTVPNHALEKVDGSMIHPVVVNDVLYWCTKAGYTEISPLVEKFAPEGSDIHNFAFYCQKVNLTPIFEYCSLENRVVLDYVKPRMILTAIRDNETGRYFNYDNLWRFAINHKLADVVKVTHKFENINDFVETLRNEEDIEGVVIRFENGLMVKIKTDWYCRIHKAIENCIFEKDVIEMILNDTIDDVKAVLKGELRETIEKFEKEIHTNIVSKAKQIVDFVEKYKATHPFDAKKFNSVVDEINESQFRSFYMNTYRYNCDYNTVIGEIKAMMLKYIFSKTQVENHRFLIGGARMGDEE